VCGLGRPGGMWNPLYNSKYPAPLGSARGASRYGRSTWAKDESDDWMSSYDRAGGWGRTAADAVYRPQPGRWNHLTQKWDDSTYEGTDLDKLDGWLSEDTDGADLPTGTAFPDFVPDAEDRKAQILFEVENLPASQWDDYLTPVEMEIVSVELREGLAEEHRQDRKVNRKNRRRSAKHRQGRNLPTFSSR
jgi:hypothetical protein